MITVFNRKALILCTSLDQRERVCSALRHEGIPYRVKPKNRTPAGALLNTPNRESARVLGQQPDISWTYTVYVKRGDWEQASACLRA